MPFRVKATARKHRQPSLFGEILDWMLAPLLIIWPISMAVEYALAFSIASAAYDRELKDAVLAVSRQVAYENGRVTVNMPTAALAMLQARGSEETYYQVRGSDSGIIDGDLSLPAVEADAVIEPQQVYFRHDHLGTHEVRIAYMLSPVGGAEEKTVLVQVAESEDKRMTLASEINGAVLMAQFIILPIAMLLVWFGLSKGIAPLDELRDRIRGRKPQDLSPIDPGEAPEEVRPFMHSINDLMSRLDASLRAQQRFVADAAHQMRTPLAGLKTQAELALRQRDAAGIEHAMRQIAAGADRASRLINQMLTLARADPDAPPPFERVDLVELARGTTREWVSQAMEKGIDLGFEDPHPACQVEGNALLLRELLNNLLDNAIRYTESGGRVTVRVTSGETVTLEVEDDGIGIEPKDRELVFERFYRVLGTDSEGSGLGLAIVRGIATLHHASAQLDANPRGRGTIVRIAFPRARAGTGALKNAA